MYPLHVGDTWLEPAVGCRMQDLRVEEHPGMHRYAAPQGMPALLDAIVARSATRTRVPTERSDVLIAAGATGALGAVVGALVDPGDEILLLAPYWPLIQGIVRCFHATPVDVPFIGEVDSPTSAVEAVRRHQTSRTVAVYISTPNNPTGRTIPPDWVEALARWAASQDLWILSDEVYEDYLYEGEHVYCRTLEPQRTLSVHSFSKAFGMAGNRCGYVVGPAQIVGELCKVSTHSFYSTPTASQIAALRALDGRGDAWIQRAKPLYRQLGVRAAERLGQSPPQGSTFLFFDVAPQLGPRGLMGFLEGCAQRGLFLAPGPSFGPYPTHVRLCFTSAPPDVVERGIETLAQILGR
ncbi:MAG: pyridoxal phosphate-dependent aminotransferase [Candidatus Latescibacterota bacterium]|nr:MAG: pyridoxal phosphate-dependent aminotransferase [Candidatus Latescibacterota bacterium]